MLTWIEIGLLIVILWLSWQHYQQGKSSQISELNSLFQTGLNSFLSQSSIQNQKIDEQLQNVMQASNILQVQLVEKLNSVEKELRREIQEDFLKFVDRMEKKIDALDKRVEERLNEGMKNNSATFNDIMNRLTTIDEAQKKIDGLSTNIISLQDVLTDKKSRGIFGEIQLSNILKMILGEKNDTLYALQYTLKNRLIVDAILFLPEPLGNVAIDSKFPLENYQRMVDKTLSDIEREQASKLFKSNVKKHIQDIATKYIIAGETASEAFMFIPAEAIFAEIHAYHPDLVLYAQSMRVWITSPTTLMATLTMLQVLVSNQKREAYAHVIQVELGKLSKEFERYENRWQQLTKDMDKVYKDVRDIQTTTDKIGKRFIAISDVEMELPIIE